MINNKIIKRSEIIEKKSKFLGFSFYLKEEDKVKEIIAELKKEYKDAQHIVYAYRINNKEKFYNDKEPVQTAGQPILYLLQKKEIDNTLIVIIRYFGGHKLGRGGLIRAYTKTAQEALY